MRWCVSLLVLAGLLGCGASTDKEAASPTAKADTGELVKPKIDSPAQPLPKPKINHAAIDKAGLRLGVQAYTFRAMSTFEVIDLLKELGIKYIELYPGQRFSKELPSVKTDHNLSAEHTEMLIRKLKDSGITAVNYGVVGLSKNESESRKVFDWARKMGLETIVSEPAPEKETFDTVEKLCEEYQINVALHDHPYPTPYWYPQRILEVTKGRATKRIGSCADTGHWYRSGFIVTECLKKLEGKVISLHLKDLDEQKRDIPWGQGQVNAKAVMAEVMRQKPAHKPVFSVEYESSHGTELIANVAKCAENFSRYAEELTAGN